MIYNFWKRTLFLTQSRKFATSGYSAKHFWLGKAQLAELLCQDQIKPSQASKETSLQLAVLFNVLADILNSNSLYSEADGYYKKAFDIFHRHEDPLARALEEFASYTMSV